MLELIIGIVLGALFSPFWMKLYTFGKDWINGFMNKPTPPQDPQP
jgi:hypothetical protein